MIDTSTHELSAWELFTNSWRVFFKHIGTYVGLLLIYIASFALVGGVIFGVLMLVGGLDNTSIEQFSTGSLIAFAIIGIIGTSVVVYAALLYSIALLHTAHQSIIGNDISIKAAISYAKSSSVSSFLKLGFIKGLYLIGLTLLFVIPGVIYGLYWTFSSQSFIVDGMGYPQALDQSKSLIKGRWWKLFGKFFLVGLIYIGIAIIIIIPISIIGVVLKSSPESVQQISGWLSILGEIIQQLITQSASIVGAIMSMMIFLNRKHIYSQQTEQQTQEIIAPIITEHQ